MTTLAPKFSMARNPVYQVDCSFAASGKRVSATKRRVRFRFGFSNAEALAQGLSGTDCRGEEHEVTLTWSLTSGKRLVLADGQEVHFSMGKRADTRFETSWTMNGNHTLKLVAHAAPPLRAIPGFRQFDLFLDGLSYFEMPKIYELGVKNPSASRQVEVASYAAYAEEDARAAAYNNYSLPDRHEYYEEERRADYVPKDVTSTVSPTTVVDRGGDSPPQDLMSDPTPGVDLMDAAPVALFDTSAPPLQQDEFAPVEPVEQPRNPSQVHNEILSAYGPTTPSANPNVLALTNGEQVPPPAYVSPESTPNYYNSPPPQQQNQYATPPQQQQNQYAAPPQQQYYNAPPQQQQYYNTPPPPQQQYQQAPPPQYTAPPPAEQPETAIVTQVAPQQLTMNQLMEEPLDDGVPKSEMERALESLVNIEDISVIPKAPEQKKVEQKREAKRGMHKSVPLPPTEPSWHLGTKPALSDIKANAPVKEPKKEVMRTHAFDPRAAQAGMLVCYGAPQQLSSPGFGVPAQMQQQQQQYMYAQYMQQQRQQQMYAGY